MAQTVRAWTIQTAACWDEFQRRGVLRGDGRRVWSHSRPAYRWLVKQMRARLPGRVCEFPVWFWYSPKPDLRRGGHLPRGERGVRLELELPCERALLLDFETWHCVLNGWHLSKSWKENREWERKTKGLVGALPPVLAAEREATWERVFDFELLRRARMWGAIDRIQGVTDCVRLDEVRRVTEFAVR